MRLLALSFLIVFLVGCSHEETSDSSQSKDSSQPEQVSYRCLVSDNPEVLFTGLNNDLTIDSTTFLGDTTWATNDYTASVQYNIYEDRVNRITQDFSMNSKESFESGISGLESHFNRVAVSSSKSESYYTWILDYDGRPLLEISLFTDTDKLKINLSVAIRQHI